MWSTEESHWAVDSSLYRNGNDVKMRKIQFAICGNFFLNFPDLHYV